MTVMTLLTDFGLKDGNVGVMKGVIWRISPQVNIVDLSHLIGAQNVREAAVILARSTPYFPVGTIHVAVVDPGVGTQRRPIAARIGNHYYIGPDNGIFSLVWEHAEASGVTNEFYHLDRPQYWLPRVSNVFHGRDIFAPVAAHLANNVELSEVGTSIDDPVKLQFPHPERLKTGWRGEIIHIDHFGNLSTNMYQEHLGETDILSVRLSGVKIEGLVRTFGERSVGELVALYGSTGNLIIAEVNGSAATRLGARVGDPVEVYYSNDL